VNDVECESCDSLAGTVDELVLGDDWMDDVDCESCDTLEKTLDTLDPALEDDWTLEDGWRLGMVCESCDTLEESMDEPELALEDLPSDDVALEIVDPAGKMDTELLAIVVETQAEEDVVLATVERIDVLLVVVAVCTWLSSAKVEANPPSYNWAFQTPSDT